MDSEFFGWETIYDSVEGKIKRKEDLFILLLHLTLLKHFEVQCVNNKNEVVEFKDWISPDWHERCFECFTRYIIEERPYRVLAYFAEKGAVLGLEDMKATTTKKIVINVDEAKEINVDLAVSMPNAAQIMHRIQTELMAPLFPDLNLTPHEPDSLVAGPSHQPDQNRVFDTKEFISYDFEPPITHELDSEPEDDSGEKNESDDELKSPEERPRTPDWYS